MPWSQPESSLQSAYTSWIELRLDRLSANLAAVKNLAPQADVLAVIKANAYGHGLCSLAQALEGQVRYLGVSALKELLEIKAAQICTPVFMFGRLDEAELRQALMPGVTLSVSSLAEARILSELAQSSRQTACTHLKIDTGMGRFGLPLAGALGVVEKIAKLPGLDLEGIYTHFATAEIDDGFAEIQLEDFTKLIQALDHRGIRFRLRHAANSAGIFKRRHPLMNMVRPGLMLYGIYPDECFKKSAALAPVLTLKTRIALVKAIEPGATAGYGREFRAHKKTHLAVLPLGYSQGYPWSAWRTAEVLRAGKRFKIAGRISMDYITIDLNDFPAQPGDEVTLIGESLGDEIHVSDVAQWAGTIPYEVLTRLSASLPRITFQESS